jgi:hypothetical protein
MALQEVADAVVFTMAPSGANYFLFCTDLVVLMASIRRRVSSSRSGTAAPSCTTPPSTFSPFQ